jgi:ComF family protein
MPASDQRTPVSALSAVSRWLVDLCLPPQCLHCSAALADHGGLCGSCWQQLNLIARPYCERLGTPFAVDPGPGAISPEAAVESFAFDRARAAVYFDGPARALVHGFKYRDRLDLAAPIAGFMTAAGRDVLAVADVIVPVPLHRVRLWRRRYNQSAVLARAVAGQMSCDCELRALRRIRNTPPQVGLTEAQRKTNLAGAFRAADSARPMIENRHVILIDDVLTTGATANACARALKRAGAKTVDVLTFARVVDLA